MLLGIVTLASESRVNFDGLRCCCCCQSSRLGRRSRSCYCTPKLISQCTNRLDGENTNSPLQPIARTFALVQYVSHDQSDPSPNLDQIPLLGMRCQRRSIKAAEPVST